MRLVRLLLALVLAGLLLWPVNALVRGFMAAWGGEERSFGDGCLVIIIVLLCILLLKPSPRPRPPQ